MRLTICTAFLICALATPAYAQQQQPGPVPVATIKAERKPITKTRDFVGRIDAVNKVEVRARVKGYLEAVLFKEGDMVKEGASLYRIERGLFEAVGQAQGWLQRAQGALVLARQQLRRAQELLARQAGTEVARDQAVAAEAEASGAVTVDQANLKAAQINLGYTEINAPIAGKIGRTNVTKGNVVGPSTGTLTTIVSQDPMHVTFPVSQREFLGLEQAGRQVDVANIGVRLRLADGSMYDQKGTINFVDVSVDRATDTVLVRATVPNPNGQLVDGQLVRAVLESGTPEEKIVIPQGALVADQEGVYVFVVEDGKAAVRPVKTGGPSGSDVVIDSGLEGGEQVIVEGIQSVRPGTPVRAAPLPATASQG